MYIQIAVANDLRFKCRAPINYAVLLLARLMGRYCFSRCRLSSSVVCNTAGGRSGRPPGARAVPRPILHGGPVVLRPVRATACFNTRNCCRCALPCWL